VDRVALEGPEIDQAAAVVDVVQRTFGADVRGIYVYGSAVVGGLKSASDLDLVAVVGRPSTHAQRVSLGEQLIPISRRGLRPVDWRPVELTVVASADLTPWTFPPRTDFQYGEWLREEFDRGEVDPQHPDNPDLCLLIEMVRRNGKPLVGPPADALLPVVPAHDLRAALLGVIPDLMSDLEPDTANVLLTLARVWHTIETNEFTSKDAAADWAITRLGSASAGPLAKARDVYLGTAVDQWEHDLGAARVTAADIEARIRHGAGG
jgi:streptomycin 3"-adenylyltransferase